MEVKLELRNIIITDASDNEAQEFDYLKKSSNDLKIKYTDYIKNKKLIDKLISNKYTDADYVNNPVEEFVKGLNSNITDFSQIH